MPIHCTDADELGASGPDTLTRMLQHKAAESVMGLHAEPMSEEEIFLLKGEAKERQLWD